MKWGQFDLHLISDGRIWLDGGAMFGVVPKPLWQKRTTPDDRNRIPLGLNCLLIQSESTNVLIDTGCGDKFTDKERAIYNVLHESSVPGELKKFGLDPEDIHVVINTHLHFDHCGWNTRREGETYIPTFANADYVMGRQEYSGANHPNERTRSSYLPENWQPVADAGQLRIVPEGTEVMPGITMVPTPGHTPGHQSIKIESEGKTLFYFADLCPTTAHIPLPWIMGYDQEPIVTLETRKRIYRQAVDEEWLLFFEHDPETPTGYIQEKSGKYLFHPQDWTD